MEVGLGGLVVLELVDLGLPALGFGFIIFLRFCGLSAGDLFFFHVFLIVNWYESVLKSIQKG